MRTNPRFGGRMMLAAVAALAALLALPCAARADPAPLAANGIPVDPNAQVEGSFEAPGEQDWRVYLRQGLNYAVWTWSGDPVTTTVRAAGGRTLTRYVTLDDEGAHGGGFRAPYTGLYEVAVTATAPTRYAVSAGRDCPGDRSTPCGIGVGQTLRGLQARFVEDDDWFGTRLEAGVPYTAQAGDEGSDGLHLCVGFRDQRGAVVAGPSCGDPGGVAFTPPAAGLYFLEVSPGENDAPATYSLTLGR